MIAVSKIVFLVKFSIIIIIQYAFSHIVFFAQSVSREFDKSLPCYTPDLVVVF